MWHKYTLEVKVMHKAIPVFYTSTGNYSGELTNCKRDSKMVIWIWSLEYLNYSGQCWIEIGTVKLCELKAKGDNFETRSLIDYSDDNQSDFRTFDRQKLCCSGCIPEIDFLVQNQDVIVFQLLFYLKFSVIRCLKSLQVKGTCLVSLRWVSFRVI